MLSSTIEKIGQKAMESVKQFKPDLSTFKNGKDFNELWNANVKFCQVYYYDRTEGKGYTGYQTSFVMDLDRKEQLQEVVKLYHEKLEEAQNIVCDEMGLSEYEKRDYHCFDRVGDSIGIAHMDIFVRNKTQEDEERKKRLAEQDDFEKVSCSRCGDGGCPQCDSFFQ